MRACTAHSSGPERPEHKPAWTADIPVGSGCRRKPPPHPTRTTLRAPRRHPWTADIPVGSGCRRKPPPHPTRSRTARPQEGTLGPPTFLSAPGCRRKPPPHPTRTTLRAPKRAPLDRRHSCRLPDANESHRRTQRGVQIRAPRRHPWTADIPVGSGCRRKPPPHPTRTTLRAPKEHPWTADIPVGSRMQTKATAAPNADAPPGPPTFLSAPGCKRKPPPHPTRTTLRAPRRHPWTADIPVGSRMQTKATAAPNAE